MSHKSPLVVYHASCYDGFCAAWAAYRRLGGNQYDESRYHAAHYGTEPPDCSGRDVYVLDFCYKYDQMSRILSQCSSLVVIDHHSSAEGTLLSLRRENPMLSRYNYRFDKSKSGGRLAWEFFFPGETTPWLVDYTEDRDLWKWKLPYSRQVNAALRSYEPLFAQWDEWAGFGLVSSKLTGGRAITEPPNLMIHEGAAVLRREDQIVQSHVANARPVTIAGHEVFAVNATVLFSEIAGELAKGRPFGACYFDRHDGKRQWSLRSDDNGLDVSKIAESLGGGGHPHAAGFEEVISR